MSDSPQPGASAFAEALGGGRGLVDSALPGLVFVVVKLLAHSLTAALVAAVLVGVLVLVVRLVRKEPVQQAVSGFFGLAIAVAVAAWTGSGKGFFLPGIVLVLAWGVGAVVSLLIRRPFVGPVVAALDERYAGWRDDPALYRACWVSTAVWAGTFFLRGGVALYVYQQPGDHEGRLFLVITVVKTASILLAGLVTYRLVTRARPADAAGDLGRHPGS